MKLISLFEAPIINYEIVGDMDKRHSYQNKIDRRLVSHPASVERIKASWLNTKQNFNIFIVNNKEGKQYQEVGNVSMTWLADNMPETLEQFSYYSEAINVLFTNNSGEQRVPMTPWIMAHRVGHVLRMTHGPYGTDIIFSHLLTVTNDILKTAISVGYGINIEEHWGKMTYDSKFSRLVKAFFANIGTMKSARENNLRSIYEFIYECFAQYLLKGEIKFNTAPEVLTYYSGRRKIVLHRSDNDLDWGYLNDVIEHELKDHWEMAFDELLDKAVGRIYVM